MQTCTTSHSTNAFVEKETLRYALIALLIFFYRQQRNEATIATTNWLRTTPDFSRCTGCIRFGRARCKYMNKPYGLLHWLQHTFQKDTADQDGIVILMHPDMILLRPIVHDYTHQKYSL